MEREDSNAAGSCAGLKVEGLKVEGNLVHIHAHAVAVPPPGQPPALTPAAVALPPPLPQLPALPPVAVHDAPT